MEVRVVRKWIGAGLAALLMVMAALVAPAIAADDGATGGSSDGRILKIGWSQDVQTLNPFTGLDEENWTIWAINWDMLVNFSPKDLSPVPGIAESWEVSDDKKTVTFKLGDRNWSDGEPITSADVKWTLETLGSKGALFTSYTENVTSIETPDDRTVVIKTSRPDARIVGGLVIYILPKHIWGKVPAGKLTSSYQPDLPLVGSGPYIVTEFDRGRMIRMERNPEFTDPVNPGKEPKFDEIQLIKYGNQDAVERALQVGEVDLVPEVQQTTFERLGGEANVETMKSSGPGFVEMAFNLCPKQICPDARVNPAIQDRSVRQAIAFGIDRDRINQIAALGTATVANGLLPSYYKAFYEEPEETYPYDPARANQILDEAGYEKGSDGIREKDGNRLSFDLYTRTRSEDPFDAQAAKLAAEMAQEIGVEFKPQQVSVDKLTELTTRTVDGKPAPDFDTFIWGWTGDAFDPSFLLSLMTTGQIGESSDAFYSNPEYDKLFEEQSGVFDIPARKEIIARMINILQRDLPYLVLIENPVLQAWRTDRIANIKPVCPEETGDAMCLQTGYEPILDFEPVSGGDSGGGGGNTALIVIIAVVVIAGAGLLVMRARRRRDNEPVEIEEIPEEDDGR